MASPLEAPMSHSTAIGFVSGKCSEEELAKKISTASLPIHTLADVVLPAAEGSFFCATSDNPEGNISVNTIETAVEGEVDIPAAGIDEPQYVETYSIELYVLKSSVLFNSLLQKGCLVSFIIRFWLIGFGHVPSEAKDLSKSSLYDSGRTDSGFLSGANLLSDTIVSEEIRSSSPAPGKSECDKSECKSYSRLDSGVDVGLSDQLSELCIEETDSVSNNNSSLSRVNLQDEPVSPHKPIQNNTSLIPWEYYFQQDEEGDTKLHIAIIQGFIGVVVPLIQSVPQASYLNIRNDMRQTPLHLAVLTGQSSIVRRLVCAGADSKIVDHDGNTPLHLAVAAGDFPCVKALTSPIAPSEKREVELRYPVPAAPKPMPDMYNYEGLTCVHIAILGGHIGILKYLVTDVKANINARECKRGMTCLHMACEVGNESLAMILLEMGANHSLQNYARDTPYGVARNHVGILRLLLASGASPEVFSDTEEEEEEEDNDDDFQMYTFRDLHINGVVNATA